MYRVVGIRKLSTVWEKHNGLNYTEGIVMGFVNNADSRADRERDDTSGTRRDASSKHIGNKVRKEILKPQWQPPFRCWSSSSPGRRN